jgi:hypothetical protein
MKEEAKSHFHKSALKRRGKKAMWESAQNAMRRRR